MTNEQKIFLSNLIETATPDLTPFLLKRMYSVSQVEEILQETYLAACLEVDALMKHENPKGWLFTAAVYRAKRLQRKIYRHENKNQELTREILEARREEIGDPRIIISDTIDEILPNDTPEKDRKILKLRYEQKMTSMEIAKEMGTTHSNARQLLSRAHSRLKNILGTNFLILLILV